LRNHGLLTVGRSIADAFQAMYFMEAACAIQIKAQSGGSDLLSISPEIIATAREQAAAATRGQGSSLVWPGLMRRLDRRLPGYER
jgi:ribulose-5-phosphate 4-epimerase/fuculose-1-phosphate aldolase